VDRWIPRRVVRKLPIHTQADDGSSPGQLPSSHTRARYAAAARSSTGSDVSSVCVQGATMSPGEVDMRSHSHAHPRGEALARKLVRIHSKLRLSSSVGSSVSGVGGDLTASEGEVLPLRLRRGEPGEYSHHQPSP
jgi:hypothetical protein